MFLALSMMQCGRAPQPGAQHLKRGPKRDNDPGGPNDTQRIIIDQEQYIKYPYYRIKDTQSLKDKQMHRSVQFTLV